jgi:hypothetical protein
VGGSRVSNGLRLTVTHLAIQVIIVVVIDRKALFFLCGRYFSNGQHETGPQFSDGSASSTFDRH